MFKIYKPGQGKFTRIITFLSVMGIAVIGAYNLSAKLLGYSTTATPYLRFGIPVAALIVLGLVVFWLVNRVKSADFLIATEGEMKKVSWSSRSEIVGSTKVVIVTTFVMAAALFGVDMMFQHLMKLIGVWRG